MGKSDTKDSTELDKWQKEWDELCEVAAKNKIEYLHSWDLSLKCPAVTIFDMKTFEPIHIQHFLMKGKPTHGKRLYELYTAAQFLQMTYPPTAVSLERGFTRFNTETQVLYRVHGVFNMAYKDTPQFYYPPKTVKAAILDGNATKKDIEIILNKRFPDVKFENNDESDSFAVGICHLISQGLLKWDKEKKDKRKTK